MQHWSKWKEYKTKEHKFSFKSEISERSALNELVKLSNNQETVAIQIINQSITNGWKGLFTIKNQSNDKSNRNSGAYELLEQIKSQHMGTPSDFQ